jgi:hypothetical protein
MTVLLTKNSALRAVVTYKPGRKVKVATFIEIFAGAVRIAHTERGGRWSQEQALTEFSRNGRMFVQTDSYNAAKAIGVVK